MKILFVIDRIELKYFETNDLVTNFTLIEEFLSRGMDVFITTIDKLSLRDGVAFASAARAFVEGGNLFYEQKFEPMSVESFDLVMFRPDPPVDLDYINATYVMDFVDRAKTSIINDSKAIRDFNEKLHTNLFAELMPENIVTSSKEDILEFLSQHGEIILKPLNACFGTGVMFLQSGDKNTNSIINSVTKNQTMMVMVQKYLKTGQFGDKRVLTLGDEVLDECVIKLPNEGDFKFSTHSDDFIKKATLSESERQKFGKVAQKLNSMGILMAGFDVIDGKIIEINVTSPCYFIKEINNYFSTSLEKRLVDYIFAVAEKKDLCKIVFD